MTPAQPDTRQHGAESNVDNGSTAIVFRSMGLGAMTSATAFDRFPVMQRRKSVVVTSGVRRSGRSGSWAQETFTFHGQVLGEVAYVRQPGLRYVWTMSFPESDHPDIEGTYLARPAFQVRRAKARSLTSGPSSRVIRREGIRRLVVAAPSGETTFLLTGGPRMASEMVRADDGYPIARFPLRYGTVLVNPTVMSPSSGTSDLEAVLIVAASGSYRLVQRFRNWDAALFEVASPF